MRERLDRVEQISSGVEMAASALDDEFRELRRESKQAADAVLQSARDRVPEEESGGPGSGEVLEDLSRCVDALEELHYRLLEVEVHPDVQSDDERGRAADRARESLERVREVADSLTGAAAA